MRRKKTREYAQLLGVTAHPTRLMILETLMHGMACVNNIGDLLEVRQPNVSQHLAVLKGSGLVACRRDGVSRCYYLAKPAFVRALFGILARDYPTVGPPRKGRRSTAGRTAGMVRKCTKGHGRRRAPGPALNAKRQGVAAKHRHW